MTPERLFGAMAFRHPWRSYQARILADLEAHLDDRKLHVVAAPGAGKTVLGLEIIRRIGLRCLVLAPSLLVRDQWIERLKSDFVQDRLPDLAGLVSTDLTADVPLRVSTYQGIHQKRNETFPAFELLCLDEAHHLRRSWWHTLTGMADRHDCVTLSLTATPPYDAAAREWANYDALCGPIDAEIPAPELVKSGDLCPHQDLVFAAVTRHAADYVRNREEEAGSLDMLRNDPEMLAMIEALPWIADCRAHAAEILEAAELFSAMLIYLQDAGRPLPSYARRLLQIRRGDIPPQSWDWLQVLCDGLKARLPSSTLQALTRMGALRNDRILLPPPKFTDRIEILRDDDTRLVACLEIHALERAARGADLRMAILVDRIGRLSLTSEATATGFNAVHLFRRLTADGGCSDAAIMTGQVVVLPRALAEGLAAQPLPGRPDHVLIEGRDFDAAIARANAAFHAGDVRVIVGTQAFLGQGWDAPGLNSLVLGTNLASFVAVNQLRGRALRIDRRPPGKCSNIWHIAIVPDEHVSGEDLEALQRRFACFARIDREALEIRSWFAPEASCTAQNEKARRLAATHGDLARDWDSAMQVGEDIGGRLMQETGIARRQSQVILPRGSGLASLWRRLFDRPVPEHEIRRTLGRMGHLVLESLRQLGDIGTARDITPYILEGPEGHRLGLDRATRYEETLFHETLRQVLDPVTNPRYLIVVPAGFLRGRAQLFAVPPRFDGNKRRAEIFWKNWQAMLGRGQLVYTRTVAGRGLLQSARLRTSRNRTTHNLQWK
ncbi:DEAD/DEAH box helicase family protein [Rhodovulum sulfidophilum]|uniref:DEAD/DEAH box helicase family protein n=1 Tax=Rhodovulum sulfidophilum TaxID=35806 RepID=UPI0009520E7C|nr:DEAD/DEAH box helicase family protein [Rhodovulum sulfidophilum]MBL3553943.1 DEAD/DEAH box helicase family protein [Rhodovulum sulfidophilum]OLS46830.1 hypothetical protein BV379_00005 [Rhodovulum sulfidophilum]